MTSSPPPVHNFDEIPTVHALDEFWHRKYAEDKSGRLVPVQAGASEHDAEHDGRRTGSTCRARRTGRSSRRSGCRSWRTASSTRGGWSAWARVVTLVGIYGWALEPSVAE